MRPTKRTTESWSTSPPGGPAESPSVDVPLPGAESGEVELTADDLALRVGRPSLVVLIGAAGSGKTTLATRLFAPTEVISSDELRAAISGDAADQRATRPAFRILHREVAKRLAAGRLVVVDATSVQSAARRELLRLATAASASVSAIVLALPADAVHVRNAARRERSVPREVVERHLAQVSRLVGADPGAAARTLRGEGFGQVLVLRSDDDVARVRILREPLVSPP
jgi:protein phosphatase